MNIHKKSSKISSLIILLTVFIFFVFFFLSLLKIHVSDYDFWWHIATGKYIVEHKSLPAKDPFSYTTHDSPSVRKDILLKGYWLSQVIFYKVNKIWDLKGIIVLRALSITAFLFIVFLNMNKRNIPTLISLLLVLCLFWYSLTIEGERPQLFTILVFSMVYYLLEDFRTTKSKKAYFIPLLIMILANMHPGYVICILLVSIYLFSEGIRFFLKKVEDKRVFKGLLAIWILTIIFSMINPNGPTTLMLIFTTKLFTSETKHVVEFLPTFTLYSNKMIPLDYPYIIFLVSSLLSLRYRNKIGITHMLLLMVFSFMSLFAYRYVVFYMCIVTPIIAVIIRSLREERKYEKLIGNIRYRENICSIAVLTIGIVLAFNSLHSLKKHNFKENVFFSVPKGATEFISKLKIEGNMFNDYAFGGYLIWRLYPVKKVFIDSRALEPDITREYNILAYAVNMPQQSWKNVIEKYNISHIIIQPLWQSGNIVPLVEKLFDSDEWVLIYADHLTLIFLQNNTANASIIERYRIDKKQGMNTIIVQASAWALIGVNPNYLITLGKIFYKMGRIDDARKAFSMAYERDPKNPVINEWMKRLGEGR